mmetsp:Transcript_318/g.913  ORF Transcript_318/g.913 Transcript_318/m.913 type:complete len:96 (-) Transcript_318:1068-1355(-)
MQSSLHSCSRCVLALPCWLSHQMRNEQAERATAVTHRMALKAETTSCDSRMEGFDVEAQNLFEQPLGEHPHNHYSGRAPWLRAGVLGANDGDRSA